MSTFLSVFYFDFSGLSVVIDAYRVGFHSLWERFCTNRLDIAVD